MQIKPYANNAKEHPKKQVELIAKSISRFGWQQPIKVGKDNIILAGHGRNEAYETFKDKYPMKEPWIINEEGKTISGEAETRKLTPKEEIAYRLADNQINALSGNDMKLVVQDLKELDTELIDLTGFEQELLEEEVYKDGVKNSLRESYIIPPFSIWDTKQAYWQDRKRLWISYIGYSGDGRDDDLLGKGLKTLAKVSAENYTNETSLTGTSIFDPVVAELSYRWFCPEKGKILDPFSGGHVRGSVATLLEYDYTGIDLSKKQIEVNKRKCNELQLKPSYICDNSLNIDKLIKEDVDMIFSCPPYYDLEKYNDGEGDLSMMGEYDDFLKDYEEIIKKAVDKLKDNRFAVWVVGDIRDDKGIYRGFVKDTIKAFEKAGMGLYNEIILANAIATAPLRAKRPFDTNRKVTKVHQNILCFYKGNLKDIENFYAKLPRVEKVHQNVLVFYKGDIEEIKNDFKMVNKDIDFLDVSNGELDI